MSLKRTLIPAALIAATTAIAACPAGAVINGTKVDASAFPWYAGVGVCGGTFVAPDRVLTAAHCVINRTPADLGGLKLGDQTRTYTRFAMHPNWRARNGTNFMDDIAIVELSAPIPGAQVVQLGGDESAGAWILGQGHTTAPGSGHGESAATYDTSLRMAPLKSLSDAECAALFKGKPTESGERYDKRMRCSIDADGKAPLYSGCFGDSGGPLFTGSPAAPVQLGIVSWGGDRCGADHLPSVFADVSRYRDFILDPSPTWAPKAATSGKVSIKGTRKVGRKLTCAMTGYKVESGTKLAYEWKRMPKGGAFDSSGNLKRLKVVGKGKTYAAAKGDRGGRVGCFVSATNDGGGVQVGVNNVLIKS